MLYEQEQSGLGQANTLKSLGNLERGLGHPDQARTLYDRALVLYDKEQSGLGQADTLRSLGDLESLLGHPDQALALYDQAMARYLREQVPPRTAITHAARAQCFHMLDRKKDCDEALRSAWHAAMALGSDPVSAYVVGVVEEITGGKDHAMEWLRVNGQ